jgi:hypothetical protein
MLWLRVHQQLHCYTLHNKCLRCLAGKSQVTWILRGLSGRYLQK